jgi:hypothetical protein
MTLTTEPSPIWGGEQADIMSPLILTRASVSRSAGWPRRHFFFNRRRYAKSAINLVLGFDGILPDDLNGFVAQRFHLFEGGRVAIRYRLIKAVELSDAHMLGRIAYE